MRNDDAGKDSEEKEEVETEEDELTTTETALKAAIRNMKAQKIKNLMKMVTGKNPADALAILSGSDVAFALQKREQAEIDDTFPQPNALQWVAFIQRCLKAEMLLPEAFSNLNTADLFQALTEMRQRTVGAWASLTKPAFPGDDPAAKQGFHEVVDLIEQVGLAHYEIVRAGCFLHVLLSQLFDK